MSAAVSYATMRLRALKHIYNVNLGINSAIHKTCHVHQRVSLVRAYSATSSAFRQSASTAEKSQSEGTPPEDATADSKQDEMSAKEKELLTENVKLLENMQSLDDKYKRALAENENVRIRMRREISDAKQYGIQNFVKDLVEVADVLGKATESVPKEALNNNSNLKSLFEGLQMTEVQLHAVFKRYGVSPINPKGEKFNPNHHEALFEQEDSSKEPGTVGTVTKVGYKLHERVVRPAMVGVIKGSR